MASFLLPNEVKEIAPQQGARFCYDELQDIIDGPLEAIPLSGNRIMFVDAHGRRKHLPANTLATSLVQHFLRPGEAIVGPALVVARPELDGGRILSKQHRDQVPAKTLQEKGDTARSYLPTKQECQERAELQQQLEHVVQQIAQIEARQRDPYLDDVGEYFHLSRVGGSGRGTARLNQRRARALDKSIDTAKQLEPRYCERAKLLGLIEAITSGKRKQQREAETRSAQRRGDEQARIRAVQAGEYVIDSFYGIVKVVRPNQKTLTIETTSGYRERRTLEHIKDIYRPQQQ